jgi:hypothetical protein
MKRLALALAVLAIALLLPASPALAHGKVHCNPEVGRGMFDPITAPGAEPAAHEHTFLGNRAILDRGQRADATYSSLVGTATTCSNQGDSAAYWYPTIYQKVGNTWHPLRTHAFIAYYRSWEGLPPRQTGAGNVAYAPDTRMIAGNRSATRPQSTGVVGWNCNQSSSRPGPYTSAVLASQELV